MSRARSLTFFFFFRQLHLEGKTDQAKSDLSRLAKIRAEREAAAAKRKAEAEGQTSPKDLNLCIPWRLILTLALFSHHL